MVSETDKNQEMIQEMMPNEDQGTISAFTIFEIFILSIGVMMSISSTLKPLRYTTKYVGYFVIPLMGIGMIVFLIMKIRNKWIPLVGFGFIFLFMFVGGFGAIVCELNSSRYRKINNYKEKEIVATYNGTEYRWDGETITYDSTDFTYLSSAEQSNMELMIDGEKCGFAIMKDTEGNFYMEIDGSSGIFIELKEVD